MSQCPDCLYELVCDKCKREDRAARVSLTRAELKKEYHDYQEAARRLCEALPSVTVIVDVRIPDHPTVHVSTDRDGAFVDAVIWVPKEKIDV